MIARKSFLSFFFPGPTPCLFAYLCLPSCAWDRRRLGYALLTDFAGTERNPEFISAALQAVGGNKRRPVIVMCGRGGSLDSSVERKGKKFTPPERLFGTQSRYNALSIAL